MCGRYVSPEEADIERTWNKVRIRNPLGLDSTRFNPNWNVAPTHQVPALRRADPESDASGAERGTELVALRWGLPLCLAKYIDLVFRTMILRKSMSS